MIEKQVAVEVKDDSARSAAKLVQIASQYKSKVNILQENKTVNAKSIMGMMTLGPISGRSIGIMVEGEDENDAINSIENYLLGHAQ